MVKRTTDKGSVQSNTDMLGVYKMDFGTCTDTWNGEVGHSERFRKARKSSKRVSHFA